MSTLSWLQSEAVDIEVTPGSMQVSCGDAVRTWPLERDASGEWTAACRRRIGAELPTFLNRKPWQPKGVVRCALPASGATLRRWTLPRASGEALHRLVAMQIEAEFPLPPEELAWGWMTLGGTGATQEVVVAAVKRSAVHPLTELLDACGLDVTFTLSALARAGVGRAAGADVSGIKGWLEVGRDQSEWLVMDEKGPVRLRVVPWGEQTLVREWTTRLGVTAAVAEEWLDRWVSEGAEVVDEASRPGWMAALQGLSGLLPGPLPDGRVQVTGRLGRVTAFRVMLGEVIRRGVPVKSAGMGDPLPAALRGMRDGLEGGLWMSTTAASADPEILAKPASRKWAMVAASLLLGVLALPYVEAIALRPGLATRVASIKSKQGQLQLIDRESDFLRHLRQNQAPYHDTLVVLSKTLPPGSRMELLNLNRKGEMSLRVSMRQPPEVTDFRTKLTDSGFFTSVVIEEQSPSPDRQKIQVRISGQVKPANARQGLKILAVEEPPTAGGAGGGGPAGPGRPQGGPMSVR